MGLRLAALEALQAGGVVEFGEPSRGPGACGWPCRLNGLASTRAARRTAERRLRVLVVDDHEVVHWGLRMMLGEQPWVERCVSARNGEEALALAARYEPHVALVDLFIGEESGAQVSEALRAASPRTRVLLISGAGRISPAAARAAGAAGFVSEGVAGARDRRGRADGRARDDGVRVEEPPGNRALRTRARGARPHRLGRDEPRDRRAAAHLAVDGQGHTSTVYRKLNVRNRAEAVQRAQRLGLIT